MTSCVSSPGDRDWCRENAARWMPQVFDILDQPSPEIEMQMDALTPEFLPIVLGDQARDVDGVFKAVGYAARPYIVVAGLYSTDKTMDAAAEDDWEQWKFTINGHWRPTYMAFYPWGNRYIMSRMAIPTKLMVMPHDQVVSRDEAVSVAASLMSKNLRNAKLFFSFSLCTEPWAAKRRKGLAEVLNALTRKTAEDACCWLTRTHPRPDETQWQYPTLGPQQPVWAGAIHASLGPYVWHNALNCNIRMSEERKKSPVHINIMTTW